MKRIVGTLALVVMAVGATACTESERASKSATWSDQPADITCWTYGTEHFQGRSTGKVEYDEGGRMSFVDASNNRYTTIEGDCRVVYMTDGEANAPPAPPAPAVPPAPAG